MTRYSADKDDPGYAAYSEARSLGLCIVVLLDGAEVPRCVTADEDEGSVVRCVLDENGDVQLDPRDSSVVWTERAEGRVEVRLEKESKT